MAQETAANLIKEFKRARCVVKDESTSKISNTDTNETTSTQLLAAIGRNPTGGTGSFFCINANKPKESLRIFRANT